MNSTALDGTPIPGASQRSTRRPEAHRHLAIWLLLCCVLVGSMVMLGGVTRLTGSGLSMVTWKPVHGVVPPRNADEWAEEFARYQQSPEYREVNRGMSVDAFKRIFWFEYAHRLLGRAIGLAFALPFLWFLVRRRIPARLVPRLVLMFALGGAQGLLGWWMVRSGLMDVPHVSAYRLTAHLGLAVALFIWMLWTALGLLRRDDGPTAAVHPRLGVAALLLLGLAVVAVLSGGFVAGLKAGLVYNSFPMMGEHWIPPEIGTLSPWWRDLFENVSTVQLDHRLLAMLVFGATLAMWGTCLAKGVRGAGMLWCHAAAALVSIQLGLGIATLLLRVPVTLAALHQGNALLLLAALTGAAFALSRR